MKPDKGKGRRIRCLLKRLANRRGEEAQQKGYKLFEALRDDGYFVKVAFSKKWDKWDRRGVDACGFTYSGHKVEVDFKSSITGVKQHLEREETMGDRATIPFLIKWDESLEEAKQRFIHELNLERPYWL